jgi:hypothetical protein
LGIVKLHVVDKVIHDSCTYSKSKGSSDKSETTPKKKSVFIDVVHNLVLNLMICGNKDNYKSEF